MDEFTQVWGRASVGELSWLSPLGPQSLFVVPLVLHGRPCAALPYLHAEHLGSLSRAEVVLSVSDVVAGGRVPMAARGAAAVVEDPEGDEFLEHLLMQEVVKHPPTRLRSDTLMGRREHWWWLPRILVSLAEPSEPFPIAGRDRATDAVLVTQDAGRPTLQVVTAAQWPHQPGDRIDLFGRDGNAVLGTGPALAFSHQFSPDFERWDGWWRRGQVRGGVLTVESAHGEPREQVEPLALVERFRRHRATASACRAGLRAAGHG